MATARMLRRVLLDAGSRRRRRAVRTGRGLSGNAALARFDVATPARPFALDATGPAPRGREGREAVPTRRPRLARTCTRDSCTARRATRRKWTVSRPSLSAAPVRALVLQGERIIAAIRHAVVHVFARHASTSTGRSRNPRHRAWLHRARRRVRRAAGRRWTCVAVCRVRAHGFPHRPGRDSVKKATLSWTCEFSSKTAAAAFGHV